VDVDVVVVGTPNLRTLLRANACVEDKLGVPAQLIVVTPEEWNQQTTRFIRDVRRRPLLDVVPGRG